jgi:hypothetical protein
MWLRGGDSISGQIEMVPTNSLSVYWQALLLRRDIAICVNLALGRVIRKFFLETLTGHNDDPRIYE